VKANTKANFFLLKVGKYNYLDNKPGRLTLRKQLVPEVSLIPIVYSTIGWPQTVSPVKSRGKGTWVPFLGGGDRMHIAHFGGFVF
jgi:hypothetical protein